MGKAVTATKIWCLLGTIGWAIVGFGYWAYQMVGLLVMNSYYPGTYGLNHYAGVWCRTAIVIVPIVLSCSWYRHARRNVYRIACRRTPRTAKVPNRVVAVNLPGVLLGLLCGIGIISLLLAAFS